MELNCTLVDRGKKTELCAYRVMAVLDQVAQLLTSNIAVDIARAGKGHDQSISGKPIHQLGRKVYRECHNSSVIRRKVSGWWSIKERCRPCLANAQSGKASRTSNVSFS
jgi:hypothetical protein